MYSNIKHIKRSIMALEVETNVELRDSLSIDLWNLVYRETWDRIWDQIKDPLSVEIEGEIYDE